MQDQQVEVVSGPHAVARVAGAVVLVAHRGTGRPTPDSPAVRALVALAELVSEAAARQAEGPGAAIAREATRWLMTYPARSGPGSPVDFGILSAAGPDRMAIFLHGAVTAVVAGESIEYFHGRDAAFTVDRTAAVPSRAVALFVDDPLTDPDDDVARPALPAARGIGRLVEGIAEAGGAIAWAPAVRRAAASAEPGRSSGVVLGKRAVRRTPEQLAGPPATPDIPPVSADGPASGDSPADTATPWDASDIVTASSTGAAGDPEDAETRTAVEGPAPTTADPERASSATTDGFGAGDPLLVDHDGEAHLPDTGLHHAQTQISGRQPPRPSLPGEGIDETAGSRPGGTDSPRRPAHHTPRMDMPVPQPTPAERPGHGPPELGTPPLDAELRRRTEATAKGTALTVKVRGFKCARAHPTDPRSAFCSVCGMPVDQTQPLIEVVRPPLGILVLDDGSTYLLEADSVLGRDPEKSEPVRRGLTPLQVTDNSGGMSRAHAELRLVEWDVTLIDRGSTNGTRTRAPGFREWVRVPPHQPVILVPSTEILIGNRMLRLESAAPPPFGS